MSIKVYGIKSCDTMKKTFNFLEEKGVDYEFTDYKKEEISPELLEDFLAKSSLEALVNKKGTTYRKMDDVQKVALEKAETAIPILIENPSMIKRPLITYPDGSLTLGFNEEKIASHLG
ncbi:Spx/MgsR family RNA polymerase-binding regulatory protein [Algoriphagus aestuariicola]|uniref:Spx/MgsR family RNA polymerase-binding regulatory protein n=1 Tax=Algoriphagus aestuariicola TaxID=1852016 RepID=A0ABS3BKA5_9BACT|nr:Spx/MgsR family RNA polymerase-binding regulatory protein [Algoriphagus aestuariicola]MBN7799721.1 Spx/MgsR family RNA polymerase-binding regulatory protein [Algoriphagus aestuariicola]